MPPDRRLPESADSYPDDRGLVAAVLREPDDVLLWPAGGLTELGLTEGHAAVVATWRVDTEVRNGGFGRYFAALGADVGAHAAEALRGLERLEAAEHRLLLAAALDRLERGVPGYPERPVPESVADEDGPHSEARYQASLRRIVGSLGPDLEAWRGHVAERRRWEEELHELFREMDEGWRALARVDPLEGRWAAYVRAHPAEFFRR